MGKLLGLITFLKAQITSTKISNKNYKSDRNAEQ